MDQPSDSDLVLVQDSSRIYRVTVAGVPAGQSVTDAWFQVKSDYSDADNTALISKTITTTSGADGQITNDGSNDGTAILEFLVDNDDVNSLPVDQLLVSAVKVKLSSGYVVSIVSARRPVSVLSPGISKIS